MMNQPEVSRSKVGVPAVLAAVCATLLLSGCGMTTSSTSIAPGPITSAVGIQGRVMGGQQPGAGVQLQLYAANTTSYAGPATPVGPAFASVASGNFTVPAFTCPAGNPPIYLVGLQGTPIGSGANNPNLALMAGIGPCNTPITFLNLNELTTLASVYALSGFMTGPTNVGAPASNSTGLLNAFAAINKVVNITTGSVSGPALPAGATLPRNEINALGNILQSCVNSSGGTASSSNTAGACANLFYYTTTTSAPTETITAALNIAQHPGVQVSNLNALQASSPAFTPTINVNNPPSDWTIAISYTGGGLTNPQAVATDANGQVWVTNPSTNSVTLLDNTGKALSGANGFSVGNSPYGIAIDQSGNAWIANSVKIP